MHKRNIDLWLASLEMQSIRLEVILVVYDDKDFEIPETPMCVWPIHVDKVEGAYPEAWLKNIGIRHARGDVIACTNTDIIYTRDFFEQVENHCQPGTLVQATRFDTPEGTVVTVEDQSVHLAIPEGKLCHVICQPFYGVPVIPKASGDCQAFTREDWADLTGYNEDMKGWGGLDTDLECRAILAGKNIFQMGFDVSQNETAKVSHFHVWHETDILKNSEAAKMNQDVLTDVLEKGTLRPNEVWGQNGH